MKKWSEILVVMKSGNRCTINHSTSGHWSAFESFCLKIERAVECKTSFVSGDNYYFAVDDLSFFTENTSWEEKK